MRLSRKADYALRAVRYLSDLPRDRLGTINSISEEESIPREFLAKILKDLTRASLLVSYQGVTGGYRLAHKPKETTFLDVIEAISGPIHLNLCTEGKCNCDLYDTCEMRFFWEKQDAQFKKTLAREHFGKHRRKTGK